MSIRPIKTWSYPGALLDALVDTRRDVDAVRLPIPMPDQADPTELIHRIVEQLDHHLIPRVREEASPAIVVVAGSTGAGKSTVVNALLGDNVTASGVLRPTTKMPHLFHHPLDAEVLSEVAQRAKVAASEAVPRGLAVVDSPDLDSVRGDNREVAGLLLEAADLWIFVTTAARYGDAVPWEALREGAARGASIAMVLNRVGMDVAAQVRRELVQRLSAEGLDGLPLFVIPEDPDGRGTVPRDVVGGLGRWLDQVAQASATTIIERTLHGAVESVKDWLEELAELMDLQAAAAKTVRAEVRRCVTVAESAGGPGWHTVIASGSLRSRWEQACLEGGPLYRIRHRWSSSRSWVRGPRMEALDQIAAEVRQCVDAALVYTAAQTAHTMVESLAALGESAGPWLAAQTDPRDATVVRHGHASAATAQWWQACAEIVRALPQSERAITALGEDGMTATLASAALGIDHARAVLQNLTTPSVGSALEQARDALAEARRSVLNAEALDVIKPTDIASLMPDASATVRLRRAELRGLL